MEQSNIVNITADNFQQIIVEASQVKLVIIGFWTPRDPSCLDLMDYLAQKAAEYPEEVILAKINVDEQQDVAMQFGIQSVPTVALFKQAKPLDSFVGMKTPAEVDDFLQAHLPKMEEALLLQCQALISEGDFKAAYGLAKQAYELDAQRADIRLTYAQVSIHNGKLAEAETLLQSITLVDQDSFYHNVMSALTLAKTAADSPEIKALQQQLEQQPDDFEIKVQLSVMLSQANRHEEALELLFTVLKANLAFGDAKQRFLDMLAALPDGDPLVTSYRRKMYSLLY
ncbi:MAG: putative thioredoxin [Phenylobacterium sp.]|jgi:putative thioredoxin